jgi:hypothetical protein
MPPSYYQLRPQYHFEYGGRGHKFEDLILVAQYVSKVHKVIALTSVTMYNSYCPYLVAVEYLQMGTTHKTVLQHQDFALLPWSEVLRRVWIRLRNPIKS